MSDERLTRDDLAQLLADTTAALARKAQDAASKGMSGPAKDYAEATERLSNAMTVVGRMKQ